MGWCSQLNECGLMNANEQMGIDEYGRMNVDWIAQIDKYGLMNMGRMRKDGHGKKNMDWRILKGECGLMITDKWIWTEEYRWKNAER